MVALRAIGEQRQLIAMGKRKNTSYNNRTVNNRVILIAIAVISAAACGPDTGIHPERAETRSEETISFEVKPGIDESNFQRAFHD